jgi:hypothetical protein
VDLSDTYHSAYGTGVYLYDAIFMAESNLRKAKEDAQKLENQISVVAIPVGERPVQEERPKISGASLVIKKKSPTPLLIKKA